MDKLLQISCGLLLITGIDGTGRSYQYVGIANTMNNARTLCANLGLTLATVIDDDDREALKQAATDGGVQWWSYNYALGLHDDVTEGQWLWDDGTSCNVAGGNCIDYWNPGEPNDAGGEDCLHMVLYTDGNRYVNDWKCGDSSSFYAVCNTGGYFILDDTTVTPDEAQTQCVAAGGSLATIHSYAELVQAQDVCNAAGVDQLCYIGAVHDNAGSSCTYSWNDGSAYDYDIPRYATETCQSNQRWSCLVSANHHRYTDNTMHDCGWGSIRGICEYSINLDECASGTDTCDANNADCTDIDTTPGYYCTCHSGYDDQNGDGSVCNDINECTSGTATCDTNAQCTNTAGSYTCACNTPWYTGDGYTCSDVDECTAGTDACDDNAYCSNTDGSYDCTCNSGYIGDGFSCADNDECANNAYDCDQNADCVNTSGGYYCECDDGYRMNADGYACDEIDECAEDLDDCDDNNNEICANETPGWSCICDSGYTLNGDGVTCDDDDECTDGSHSCDTNAECTNTDGSYQCDCNRLYRGDGNSCTPLICTDSDIGTFDWDDLTEQGLEIPIFNVDTFDIDESDLSLNIKVELEYMGRASADHQHTANFGVTYVLDFEDFNAHKDDIDKPGTCQNRDESAFTGKDFANDYWNYPLQPQADGVIGTTNTLAYPPPDPVNGEWDIYMKEDDECSTVIYEGKFTWSDLRSCTQNGGGDSYTHIVTDDDWVNMTGTFYINVVSPYWYDSDFGYYRVYQLLSQPFIIAVSSVVHVLGSTGINLMTLSVIAVYKEDQESDFKLVLLSETAEYLKLTRTASDIFIYAASDGSNQLTTSDFTDNTNPENTGTNECLSNKGYICSQLWEINATDIGCEPGLGTDFSGNYKLSFQPICRDVQNGISQQLRDYCDQYLIDHANTIGQTITLDTDLVWEDLICDPIIFTVQFVAAMSFYKDATFSSPVDDDHLYQVGEDTIYVQVNTTFPDDTMNVFNVELIEVHICTFDPLLSVPNDPSDLSTFGCFNGNRDNYDQYFFKIYDADDASVNLASFNVETEGITNIVRFSFIVPKEVARDTLYVQAELEVELQELGGNRRRVLLEISSEPTANQIENFVESVGINHGQEDEPISNEPKEEPNNNDYNPNPNEQYPINPNPVINNPSPSSWTINLSSPWIIGIGCILSAILCCNIVYMFYMNCYKSNSVRGGFAIFGQRKGYKSVKIADSEDFSDSEANAINVVSE